MRHFRYIKKYIPARDVYAERGSHLAFCVSEFVAVDKRAQIHRRNILVRHLYTDGALARDNTRNTNG